MRRRVILGGLAGALLAARSAPAAEPAGDVKTSRGECYAQTALARRSLAPAAAIFIGDTVATGEQSGLSMRLGAATEVKLGAEARLRIDRFLVNAGGLLVLESGAMLCDHEPQVGKNEMTVRSPFGLLAVRGTRFFAGPNNGAFGVFVERGEVQVVGSNTAVLVRAGSGTDIARPGAEPTTPHPWTTARVADAMAQFNL
jgi:hypothetical protein